eukprot:PLAT15308.1.p1 GENE.PLAT15308.1~~PLAT15308.1.p1  ORF type:complete len:143 (-),score=70.96 PLAT15308.1:106-483(-)
MTKLLTLEEVAAHNTEDDCWIIIDGQVYNATPFLDDHPGGPDIITDKAGGDVTREFKHDVAHTKDAYKELKKLVVGHISDEDKEKLESEGMSGEESVKLPSGNSSVTYLLLAALVLGVAAYMLQN